MSVDRAPGESARSRMFRDIACFLLAGGILTCPGSLPMGSIAPAFAETASPQENWKGEFEDICAKTQDAMTYSERELKDLIARSDRLKPFIEKLDESQRKVYRKRLAMCRDLFVFVLETKEKK
jgi:hypothetical protein